MSTLPFAEVTDNAPGGSPTLLLVHGFPFDHSMWRNQIETLSRSCRVIAADLPGFGRSEMDPTAADRGLDMADYAAALVDLLDELEVTEPVIVCGFSMGGYVLWQLAHRFPDRIRALIVCDTRADADSDATMAARLKVADEVGQTGVEPIVTAMLPKLLAPLTIANRPEAVNQVAEMIRQASPASIAAAQRGMARRPDMRSSLPAFRWPALVVCGENDAISPPEVMRAITDSLPNSTYREIPDAGHMAPLENPNDFSAVLMEFIEGLA